MGTKKLEKVLYETFSGSFFFTKYPELANGKDLGDGSMPFIEGGYNSQTIVAETMRFYALASEIGAAFLMPEQAPFEQVVEWSHHGINSFFTLMYDNDKPANYEHVIAAGKSRNFPHKVVIPPKSLHVLHPYAKLPASLYAVDPKLLLWLNTKSNLNQITNDTPKKSILNLEETLKLQPPFVLKKETGSSGDGVKIVKTIEDTIKLPEFIGDQKVIVEEYIDYVKNYGINFLIDKTGETHFLGYCKQHTTPGGEFCGAICILDSKPPAGLLEVSKKACKNVAKKGYYGFLGFDVLEDKNGKFHIIDPNIRCTAATPVYILKDKIIPTIGSNVYCGSSQMDAKNPKEVINKIKSEGGMLLSLSHKLEGMYKFFAMFGGNNPEEAFYNWNNFEKKYKN